MKDPISEEFDAQVAREEAKKAKGQIAAMAARYDLDSPQLFGFVMDLDYDKVKVSTCDPWKRNCGGAPRGGFIILKLDPKAIGQEESGAMYFALAPKKAILSDINQELIETFGSVRSRSGAIGRYLLELRADKRVYNMIRDLDPPTTALKRAVRFIYLNRTCYGGLYRTNQMGVFNVPFGGENVMQSSLSRLGSCNVRLGACGRRNLNERHMISSFQSARRGRAMLSTVTRPTARFHEVAMIVTDRKFTVGKTSADSLGA